MVVLRLKSVSVFEARSTRFSVQATSRYSQTASASISRKKSLKKAHQSTVLSRSNIFENRDSCTPECGASNVVRHVAYILPIQRHPFYTILLGSWENFARLPKTPR